MARVSRKAINNTVEITNPVKKIKTALYTRLSSEKIDSDESIETQIDILKKFVKNKEELEIFKIYSDVGYTGTNFNRPNFISMMNDINDGAVKCVIVKDLSRLSRNHLETGELIFNEFIKNKIRFISVNDNYDSLEETQGMKKLIILLKNVMNEMYSRDISKKIKTTFGLKKSKGELLGGLPPLGYLFSNDGRSYIVDEEASKVVKKIFELRLRGKSAKQISNYLNDNNRQTPYNYFYSIGILKCDRYNEKINWSYIAILRILKNEVYIGNLILNKSITENSKKIKLPRDKWIIHKNKHEPIIDKDIFYEVQLLLEEASKKHVKKRKISYNESVYVNKLKCTCGLSYKKHIKKTSLETVIYYLYCDECRRQLAKKGINLPPNLKMDILDSYVIDTINQQFNLANEITSRIICIINRKSYKDKINELNILISLFEREINKKQKLISKCYIDYLDTLLDRKKYEILKQSLGNDIEGIIKDINSLNEKIEYYRCDLLLKNQWLKLFNNKKNIQKLDKKTVNNYIEKVIINPKTNEINVIFKFNNELNKINNSLAEREVKLC